MGDRIKSDIINGRGPRSTQPAVDIRDWLQQIDEGLVVQCMGGFAKVPLCNDEEELA